MCVHAECPIQLHALENWQFSLVLEPEEIKINITHTQSFFPRAHGGEEYQLNGEMAKSEEPYPDIPFPKHNKTIQTH